MDTGVPQGRQQPLPCLFTQPGVPFFGQPFELVILLIDAISDTRLVPLTGRAGSLLNQLPDVVLKDRYPMIEFGQ